MTKKFGYTIVYVQDVKASLAFASHALMADLLPGGYLAGQGSAQPLGFEIGLFVDDVAAVHRQALACGAVELAAPKRTPWGQLVAFVRCPDGTLVEICTPTQR